MHTYAHKFKSVSYRYWLKFDINDSNEFDSIVVIEILLQSQMIQKNELNFYELAGSNELGFVRIQTIFS